MAVDPAWLERVRSANRRQLGMGGMGASPGQEILSRFQSVLGSRGGTQTVERPPESKLPTYLMIGSVGVAAIGLLVVGYRWWKEQ